MMHALYWFTDWGVVVVILFSFLDATVVVNVDVVLCPLDGVATGPSKTKSALKYLIITSNLNFSRYLDTKINS